VGEKIKPEVFWNGIVERSQKSLRGVERNRAKAVEFRT
jgi:hypothetical protein